MRVGPTGEQDRGRCKDLGVDPGGTWRVLSGKMDWEGFVLTVTLATT